MSFFYLTKPTALNQTIFLFVDTNLTSFIGDLQPANSPDINTVLHKLANAHCNSVSGLEEEEKFVDSENKEATIFDSDDGGFTKEKSEK